MVPSLPLLSCELSVSVKENPDRKKRILPEEVRNRWQEILTLFEEIK